MGMRRAFRQGAALLSCCWLLACNRQQQNAIPLSLSRDSIALKDSIYLQYIRSGLAELNMIPLNKTTDSLSFRITLFPWVAVRPTGILIRYSDHAWHTYKMQFKAKIVMPPNAETSHLHAVEERITRVIPALPYPQLCDSLKRYLPLPRQEEIPGFRDNILDGHYFIIEWATPQYWRAVSYHSPGAFTDSTNRRAAALVRFLETYVSRFED